MDLPQTGANGNEEQKDSVDPIASILKMIREGQRFLVCSHAGPDGDAVGSMLAMASLLQALGKQADLVSADRIPETFRTLPGAESIRIAIRVHGPYDAAIVLECDGPARTQLQDLEKLPLINIDHHASGIEYAQINWIDRNAVSVGEMVHRLFRAAHVEVTPEAATCIYTTVLTETGGFVYGGTWASTFELARDLTLAGADPIRIAQRVYFSKPMAKLLLLGAALQNLHREGRLAWLWITHNDMVRSCAGEEDCEGVANYALSIAGVEASAFLREGTENHIHVSLRSKGQMNVAAAAERLGGGGHRNASGCVVPGPLEKACEQVVEELRHALAGMAAEPG